MKRNAGLIGVAFITVSIFSCKGADYSKELSTIDSLRNVLRATDSLAALANPEETEEKAEEIENNCSYIQMNVNKVKDTLDFNSALLLTEYRGLAKELESVAKNGKKLEAAVDSVNRNLDDLAHDLTNNSLADGLTAAECVKKEADQVKEMREYADVMLKKKADAQATLDTLQPKINDYVRQMNLRLLEVQPKK